jgi:hypothetical protein
MSTCKTASVTVKSVSDEEFNRVRNVLGVPNVESFFAVQVDREGNITLFKAASEFNEETFRVPVKQFETITPACIITWKGSDGTTVTTGGQNITQIWEPIFS